MPRATKYSLHWRSEQGVYELRETRSRHPLSVTPGTAAWFTWLDSVSSFTFYGQHGHLTMRQEARPRGDRYWYAYRRVDHKLTKRYLGRSRDLTLVRLEEIASLLSANALLGQAPSYGLVQSQLPARAAVNAPLRGADTSTKPGVPPALLLATKLSVPRPRAQLVHRAHLIERLQQIAIVPLTLVSAPAGFGKTTLLAQWQATCGMPVSWLSLETQDNEPVRFFSYLLAAIERLLHLGILARAQLEAPQPAPLEHVLILLINDIVAHQTGDFALVLDDYHVIEADAIHREIAFLLEHLPPQMHLVLATRTDPPLLLAHLRAHGQLTEVRVADLRFDTNEAYTFLHTVMGLDLPIPTLATIEQRTEGWIAGLQLAALSLQGKTDAATFLSTFTGSHHFILDYLTEEVLSRQSAAVQSFLLATSILERLCGSLCDVVTGQQGGQTMLESLERTNLFVVSLDDERQWYRYHHLFAEVLKNRLQQTNPQLLPQLHLQASTWYEQHGFVAEAIQHTLAAPDFEQAARLIEDHGITLISKSQYRALRDWIAALPETLVYARPLLTLIHATVLTFIWNFAEARACLEMAEDSVQANERAEPARLIAGWAAQCRAELANFASGDLASAITLARKALSLLPETEETAPLRTGALTYVARTYQISGDVTSESERLVMAMAESAVAGGPLGQMRGTIHLAWLRMLQGQLSEALATYERGLPVAPEREEFRYLAGSTIYYFMVAEIQRERNQLEAAEQTLARGMDAFEQVGGEFQAPLLGYMTLARLHQARGEYDQALATLDTFAQLAKAHQFPPHTRATGAATQAHIALIQGKRSAALSWAKASGLSPDDSELPYPREREYLTLARVYIEEGRHDPATPFLLDALRLLDRLLEDAQAKERLGSALEILILQSLALWAKGNRIRALSTLRRALIQAAPEGYVRLFVDEGTPMLILLQAAQARGMVPDYVATLLCAFGEPYHAGQTLAVSAGDELVEPLTEREREILSWLAAGASNREIARRLVVSLGTVKKHVSNICGKLSVRSRTQAVARARALHLL